MVVECPNCQAFVEAGAVGGYEYLRKDDKPSGRYVLLRCRRCEEPLLVKQDNIGNMAEGDIWGSPLRLYPLLELRVNPKAPQPIRNALEEAFACYRVRAYTATAIMCRKTIEGICHEHGIKVNNLAKSLKEMRDREIIDERLYDWSNALRLAGNEAAHDVKVEISSEDARDILDFSNAILDYLFSYRDQFEKFKQRRAARVP